MHRRYQMARIIKVAYLIHDQPRQWTRPRLAERFEVSMATIQRDVNLLCKMGIEVIPCGKRGYEIISDFFLPISISTLKKHSPSLQQQVFIDRRQKANRLLK